MGNCCRRLTSSKIIVKKQEYTILKEIAQGGFAVVYLVESHETGETYAVKKQRCSGREGIENARREVELMRKFPNRYVMEVVDFDIQPVSPGSDDSLLFIVMPFYQRGTLESYISSLAQTGRFLPETKILELFLHICKIVRLLHEANPPLAHFDLKPLNLLLTEDAKECVLTDFGSCRPAKFPLRNRTDATRVADFAERNTSPAYRSPELFDPVVGDDKLIDERVDVWSLGCILFALCFHESPFEKEYMMKGGSIRLAVCNRKYEYPSNHSYSNSLIQLIEMLLRHEISARPTIDVVVQAVESLLHPSPANPDFEANFSESNRSADLALQNRGSVSGSHSTTRSPTSPLPESNSSVSVNFDDDHDPLLTFRTRSSRVIELLDDSEEGSS